MRIERFTDGLAICGDSSDQSLFDLVKEEVGQVALIVTDPPYGNVVDEEWDEIESTDDVFVSWMIRWTRLWSQLLIDGGSFYVWGGIGSVNFRPFFKYVVRAERAKSFELADMITWKKKRAYGKKNGYLFVREECAWFVKGDAKKPRTFNVPLLNEKRGYAGYDPKYPCKSEFYRRTNVWTDVTEIMRGKLHPTQKQQRVIEIPIEVHTSLGDWVLDVFAGAGTTAEAARKLGRRFVVIEKDEQIFDAMVTRLRVNEPQRVLQLQDATERNSY